MDDRLPTLWSNLDPSSHYFSLEFFPPKTSSGFSNLQARLARMAKGLRPLFVTVTWGAGGSTATKSLELAEVCQRQLGLTTVLHLTCTNMRRSTIDEALESAKEVGIRNILALRGDPPREEYKDTDETGSGGQGTDSNQDFVWAVDLVRYIRRQYGDYFSVGVAGYPEGHADESNPEAGKQSAEHDLPYLVEKTAAGADFIMTQLTYDIQAYQAYEKMLRGYVDKDGKRVFEKIPIIPGLMPVQSYSIIKRITKLSHAKIPEDILKRIEAVKSDDEAVKRVGVEILSELVEQMKSLPQPESVPRGFHFYTLNLEKSVAFILEKTGLIPPVTEQTSPTYSSDSDAVVDDEKRPGYSAQPPINGNHDRVPRISKRRTSSVNAQPHNRVIVDGASGSAQGSRKPGLPSDSSTPMLTKHEAVNGGTGIPASEPTRKHNLMISEGQGSLGREATWDDFPNGRWGPSDSPAFGEIDGYGPSLKVGPITARKLWGHPKSEKDVTELFRRHVVGELEAVPWSDEVDMDGDSSGGPGALRAETQVIRKELLALIQDKGYWTLASQPALDGVKSEDETFGWGPPGEGWVFQKAFVEFFCPRKEWEDHLKPLLMRQGTESLGWMKTDASGVFESSDEIEQQNATEKPTSKRTPGTSGINAVTWGAFRNREIVTPTIIESESFRAWGEEAYSVWSVWRRCFPRGSDEEKFLDRMRQDLVLVNIVGNNYTGGHDGRGGELWKMLLEEKLRWQSRGDHQPLETRTAAAMSGRYLPPSLREKRENYLPPSLRETKGQYVPPSLREKRENYLPPSPRETKGQYVPPSLRVTKGQYVPHSLRETKGQYVPPSLREPKGQYVPPSLRETKGQYVPPSLRETKGNATAGNNDGNILSDPNRYVPPSLRKRDVNAANTKEEAKTLWLPHTDSLRSAREIQQHYWPEKVLTSHTYTLHDTAQNPGVVGYVMLVKGAHPRWERDNVVFAHSNLDLLAVKVAENTSSPSSAAVEPEHGKPSGNVDAANKPRNHEPIAVFVQVEFGQDGFCPDFAFAGWYRIAQLSFLEPHSPELKQMLHDKWADPPRRGRLPHSNQRWATIKLDKDEQADAEKEPPQILAVQQSKPKPKTPGVVQYVKDGLQESWLDDLELEDVDGADTCRRPDNGEGSETLSPCPSKKKSSKKKSKGDAPKSRISPKPQPDCEALYSPSEIIQHFWPGGKVATMAQHVLHGTAQAPGVPGFALLFWDTNPRWQQNNIILVRTNISILPSHLAENFLTLSEWIMGKQASAIGKRFSAESAIAVFFQGRFQTGNRRRKRSFGFAGWYRIIRLAFLEPSSRKLKQALQDIWGKSGKSAKMLMQGSAEGWAIIQLDKDEQADKEKGSPNVLGPVPKAPAAHVPGVEGLSQMILEGLDEWEAKVKNTNKFSQRPSKKEWRERSKEGKSQFDEDFSVC
ncbi:methylenetetrahydrofolate reductase 1 [Exophiala xenobiotica]|nr:methylenetetrahydrofolate reductase 1 [Exophiala xenobiotica]KAK5340540.1 methylenetetrahydrofolate reductase 1 [Exophiala xenobiotica]KAK5431038.1 methylenetetrahydrofolate reductase 1 [Exophiala xenobiotica]KAK5549383.1 methylenetetrahydrofolate reductase 1 [Chaetothyriales sp. CCFEE 6169]